MSSNGMHQGIDWSRVEAAIRTGANGTMTQAQMDLVELAFRRDRPRYKALAKRCKREEIEAKQGTFLDWESKR